MLTNFYCFTSHVNYFRLEIYKTIIGFSLWFSPLEMYNKTIIGFGFCVTLTSTLIILHILLLFIIIIIITIIIITITIKINIVGSTCI